MMSVSKNKSTREEVFARRVVWEILFKMNIATKRMTKEQISFIRQTLIDPAITAVHEREKK